MELQWNTLGSRDWFIFLPFCLANDVIEGRSRDVAFTGCCLLVEPIELEHQGMTRHEGTCLTDNFSGYTVHQNWPWRRNNGRQRHAVNTNKSKVKLVIYWTESNSCLANAINARVRPAGVQSINQSNFHSTNIPSKARLSGATVESGFDSKINEAVL